MPSQSPMKGSTKERTSANAISAGGAHQRHARQKDGREDAPAPVSVRLKKRLSDVFVVRGCWINELSFDRNIRPLHHFYAISLRIVLNFVHDVVDEEHSSARGAEKIGGIARIGNLLDIKAFAFVFDGEARFLRRQLGSDAHELRGIAFVTVLDCVYESLVESDKKIRTLGF